jgi:uncharacterized protein YndB with AHSA1/START domain
MNAATEVQPRSGAAVSTVAPQGEREIRVERVFNATPDRVWDAMTKPENVAQWWGAGHGKLEVVRMEVERGGHWRFVSHGEHGAQGFEGRYREVTPKSRIVQTFEWDGMPGHVSVETMTLEDMGDGRTMLRVVSQFHTTEERDGMMGSGMSEGLNASHAALDAWLAANA